MWNSRPRLFPVAEGDRATAEGGYATRLEDVAVTAA